MKSSNLEENNQANNKDQFSANNSNELDNETHTLSNDESNASNNEGNFNEINENSNVTPTNENQIHDNNISDDTITLSQPQENLTNVNGLYPNPAVIIQNVQNLVYSFYQAVSHYVDNLSPNGAEILETESTNAILNENHTRDYLSFLEQNHQRLITSNTLMSGFVAINPTLQQGIATGAGFLLYTVGGDRAVPIVDIITRASDAAQHITDELAIRAIITNRYNDMDRYAIYHSQHPTINHAAAVVYRNTAIAVDYLRIGFLGAFTYGIDIPFTNIRIPSIQNAWSMTGVNTSLNTGALAVMTTILTIVNFVAYYLSLMADHINPTLRYFAPDRFPEYTPPLEPTTSLDTIEETINKAGSIVTKVVKKIADRKKIVKIALQHVGEEIEEVAETAGKNIKDAAEDIEEALDHAGDKMQQVAEKTGQNIKDAAEDLEEAFNNAGNKMQEAAEDMAETITNAANKVTMSAEHAATVIQSAARGMFARNKVKAIKENKIKDNESLEKTSDNKHIEEERKITSDDNIIHSEEVSIHNIASVSSNAAMSVEHEITTNSHSSNRKTNTATNNDTANKKSSNETKEDTSVSTNAEPKNKHHTSEGSIVKKHDSNNSNEHVLTQHHQHIATINQNGELHFPNPFAIFGNHHHEHQQTDAATNHRGFHLPDPLSLFGGHQHQQPAASSASALSSDQAASRIQANTRGFLLEKLETIKNSNGEEHNSEESSAQNGERHSFISFLNPFANHGHSNANNSTGHTHDHQSEVHSFNIFGGSHNHNTDSHAPQSQPTHAPTMQPSAQPISFPTNVPHQNENNNLHENDINYGYIGLASAFFFMELYDNLDNANVVFSSSYAGSHAI